MRLIFDPRDRTGNPWYACTDDGGFDGDGATPLDAVSELAITLEKELSDRA